jgi:excisionase family DNA binding protein
MMPVTPQLYTIEQVAGLLNLHVKTVRRYVRDGRLKARRIGKEYRIARADLAEFAGDIRASETPAAAPHTRHVICSSVVDIDVISPEETHRVTTLVMASLNSRKGEPDFPRVDTIYYPERAKLRITITANLVLTCELLRIIDALMEDGRGRNL